ncbi:hypothetical protein CBM2625_U60019 [Cupriavidus taiwanensis]|nr:hypothetical protein CBM2625_U60019 [Cupriavidus taiwanensis]SPA57682.1 hypothetical protein CBM2638_U20016 [Cupriavidus taiwanensis]
MTTAKLCPAIKPSTPGARAKISVYGRYVKFLRLDQQTNACAMRYTRSETSASPPEPLTTMPGAGNGNS